VVTVRSVSHLYPPAIPQRDSLKAGPQNLRLGVRADQSCDKIPEVGRFQPIPGPFVVVDSYS
jgi:hypothetical protein